MSHPFSIPERLRGWLLQFSMIRWWLHVHTADEDVRRRAIIFLVVCGSALVTTPTLGLMGFVVAGDTAQLLSAIANTALYLIAVTLSRRGRVDLAGWLVTLGLTGNVALLSAQSGSINDSIFFMLFAPLIGAFAVRPTHVPLLFITSLVGVILTGTILGPLDASAQFKFGILGGILILLAFPMTVASAVTSFLVGDLSRTMRDLDISRREAEAASEAKSRFLANISHELRTPLNAIIGYAELMREELRDPVADADLTPDLERIHRAGNQLLGLVDELLDLDRVEAGELVLERRPFDLVDLIEEVTARARPLVEQHDNTLRVDTQGLTTPTHVGDRERLQQVLYNLLSNAAKFTHEGTITVSSQHTPDALRIEVIDDGIGMDEQMLTRVFDPFEQGGPAVSLDGGGAGIGLALTQRIIRTMGGDITAHSRRGEGTRMEIELPLNRLA